jgi:hypothetical protein
MCTTLVGWVRFRVAPLFVHDRAAPPLVKGQMAMPCVFTDRGDVAQPGAVLTTRRNPELDTRTKSVEDWGMKPGREKADIRLPVLCYMHAPFHTTATRCDRWFGTALITTVTSVCPATKTHEWA